MKESQRSRYQKQRDMMRELQGSAQTVRFWRERMTDRQGQIADIAVIILEIIIREIDVELIGINEGED